MNWSLTRKIVQGLFFALFVYIIWMTRYPLSAALNPAFLFHLDPLVMLMTSVAERLLIPGLVLTVLTLALTLVFGRVFCGWFCPLGTTMDIMAWLRKKWHRYKEGEPSPWLNAKTGILVLLFLAALGGLQAIWFFDPLTIFVRTFSFNIHPWVNGGVDRLLAQLLAWFPDWTGLESAYYWLKDAVLDVAVPHFPTTEAILLIFLAILGAVLFQRRFWCRYLCPLGALLGTCSRAAWLKRQVDDCTSNCGMCRHSCPTNAIKGNTSYLPQECIMCMDCTRACPTSKNTFRFQPLRLKSKKQVLSSPLEKPAAKGMSRADFLLLMGSSLVLSACAPGKPSAQAHGLRPPGALPENHFVDRCVRCGNCMKICPTNVLQPSMLESGLEGIWSPKMNFPASYCELECTLCGQVCPTEAIRPLTVQRKRLTKIGLAKVDHQLCVPWKEDTPCLVCEEHCPVAQKAIKITYKTGANGKLIGRPVVDPTLCIGCGICENKCPVRPKRAIVVKPLQV